MTLLLQHLLMEAVTEPLELELKGYLQTDRQMEV